MQLTAMANQPAHGRATAGRSIIVVALLAWLAGFPLARAASAQVTTATIVGTVLDASGGALPGVTVTARNVDTGFVHNVPSSDTGAYRLEFLPIGPYVVEATLQGFKTASRGGIVLNVNDSVRVDFALEIGVVTETVTVVAGSPLVNTVTSDTSKTIDDAAIQSLPMVDRNTYSLLDLTPGVQSNNNGVASASITTSSLGLGFPEQRTLINGGADGGTGSVNYYLDGGINMTALRNTGNILPNPDAIQEFKVQTNAYNAEYGRFSSGIINVITKAGTNRYRGSAFEYFRNGNMNSKEWGSQLERPPLKRNQYGGTVGGPITANKTFFFASYSGLRQTTQTFMNNAIVPTAAERTGDFRQSRTIPTDPATGQAFACNGVVGVICPGRLDPVAMRIINDSIPLANVPGEIWQGFVPSPFDTEEFLIKLDHQLTDDHRLSGSYFLTTGDNIVRAGTGNLPWASQQFSWTQHNLNVSDTWVLSRHQDQPGVVLLQPQLRRPAERSGDVAGRPRILVHRPGSAVAAADHGQRLLHPVECDRRAASRRRLLLGARRPQLDQGRARDQAGRRAVVQQDRPGHAAQQLRRLDVQQQRHPERAGGFPDRQTDENRLPCSVTAMAGILRWTAWSSSSSIRHAPSRSENSV